MRRYQVAIVVIVAWFVGGFALLGLPGLGIKYLVSQTIMPYAYADGNPVSGVDPRGLGRTGFSCGGGWGQPYRGWGYRYYGCTLWLDEWTTNGLEIAITLVGAAAAVAWVAAAAAVASGGTVAAPAWMFVAAIAATIVAVEYSIALIDWLGHNNGIYFRLTATRPYYVTYCTRHRMRVPCAYHETGGWVVYGYMWHQ